MPESTRPSAQRAARWDSIYARGAEGVSWHQDVPGVSLELIAALGVPRTAAVIDVGGGASALAACLVARGFSDVTVLDISEAALGEARSRLDDESRVTWLCADVLAWSPERSYELWHDRAVFHFLVGEDDRHAYLRALRSALRAGGSLIISTFAPDGPAKCSGLPVVRYSADELVEALGETFEPVEVRREIHVTPRGTQQPFTWLAGHVAPA